MGCGWSQATVLLANVLTGARESRAQSDVLLHTILDCAWHSYNWDLGILLKTSQNASVGKGAVETGVHELRDGKDKQKTSLNLGTHVDPQMTDHPCGLREQKFF